MKRSAAQIESSPEAQVKDGPKRSSDNREEITKLMMAQSQAIRHATLGPPFQGPTEMAKGCSRLDAYSKVQGSCKQLAYHGVFNLPPLPHDSVAAILKATKPDCNKARTWVDAHEITKADQARMRAQVEEREERKKVQHQVHTRVVPNLPRGSSANIQATRASDYEGRCDKLSPMEKVQKTHEGYQKALTEILDL